MPPKSRASSTPAKRISPIRQEAPSVGPLQNLGSKSSQYPWLPLALAGDEHSTTKGSPNGLLGPLRMLKDRLRIFWARPQRTNTETRDRDLAERPPSALHRGHQRHRLPRQLQGLPLLRGAPRSPGARSRGSSVRAGQGQGIPLPGRTLVSLPGQAALNPRLLSTETRARGNAETTAAALRTRRSHRTGCRVDYVGSTGSPTPS